MDRTSGAHPVSVYRSRPPSRHVERGETARGEPRGSEHSKGRCSNSRSALVLAAHGSRAEPRVNQRIRGYADQIARRGLFDVVTAAFHHGKPTFAAVLDGIEADQVTVVPFMTSAGYFSDVVIPAELARNGGFSRADLRLTAPVGTHSRIAVIVRRRVRGIMRSHNLDPEAVSLVVAGHGTERHDRSRAATVALADELHRPPVAAEVLTAFLDEEPRVESICERVRGRVVIIVPFLIGGGPHAVRDIPARLGVAFGADTELPLRACIGGRTLICDTAVGMLPGIVQIVEELAREAR